ncbi:MAG: Inosose dehydratase [bacterium ADurb.Bin429]|nr:MAG: Inosose dehydratase [bacterium ADurb.Bin429]
MRIPIGLELYSVRHDFARDPLGTLKTVAEMGYEGVEFAGPPALSGMLLRAMLDEVGLVCCGWHTPFAMVQDDQLAATIALNKAVGNRRVIVPGIPRELVDSRAKWRAMADFFNALADKLAPHDMVTGYHNHTVEFTPLDGEHPWDTFFGNTDPRVVMQLDTGNAMHGGADPAAILRQYPGRAGAVHLKPYTPGASEPFKAPIGEDASDWPAIFAACDAAAATDWYIVEYESDAYPPLEAVDKCLRGLKGMGK